MTKAILRLAEWLYRRFPPTVTVTQEGYDALTERVHKQDKMLASLQSRIEFALSRIIAVETMASVHSNLGDTMLTDRIEVLEAKLADLAKALANPKKSDSEVMRAAFLRGEFPRGSRAELEAQAK